MSVFHSNFTCAGLWAPEFDGRWSFEAAGGSWEFIHNKRATCRLMIENMQILHGISIKRFKAKAFFNTELWSEIYTTSVLADFFLGEVGTVGCWADGIAWSTILMKKSHKKVDKHCLCVSQIVHTSLSLFLLRAFLEGAGCWSEERGCNRKKHEWCVSSMIKWNWQSHHKNRAISPD